MATHRLMLDSRCVGCYYGLMKTSLFDYALPKELIAQKPARPRDSSKLLVLRPDGEIEHRIFRDIIEYLKPGDILVMNNSKVFRARLYGAILGRTGPANAPSGVEIFLLHPTGGNAWLSLAKPAKKLKPGDKLDFHGKMKASVISKFGDGTLQLKFDRTPVKVIAVANKIGAVPVPPYIASSPAKFEDYQTVYARKTGSVAAPTAGFHFTPELLARIKKSGVKIGFVTLHVGLGTFRPVKTDTLEEHKMHEEWGELPAATAKAIADTRKRGGRVIAVGTTTVRALEGLSGQDKTSGWVNIFIKPGYKFKIIDGLVTNFHLPRSTLLALVSALAGRDKILKAYQTAVRLKYRFYSFGDAMFILPRKD